MFKSGMLALMFAAAVSADANLDLLAEKVNAAGLSWKAETTKRFRDSEQAKILCGTWLKGHPNYMRLPLKNPEIPAAGLPSSFDARTAFGNCSVIKMVRDQSSCGSCWAFGSTESFEDRRCIQTGVDVEMSVEDTASCCSGIECGFSMGCNGGQPSAALQWMSKVGVVTGGDYDDMNKSTSCRPYSLAPCAHHVAPSAKYPACPEREYPTPKCVHACDKGYKNSYSEDKVRGMSAHSVEGVENIMAELTKGPLAVAFTVYEDLLNYKSGVYVHHTGRALGGHAVEMIGYGVENGVDYWIIKNSWNEMWGDNGYFKIKKGVNECGIEGDVSGVTFHH